MPQVTQLKSNNSKDSLKTIKPLSIEELQQIAHELRISVLEMLYKAKSGHTAGPLGTAEIFSTLYFSELNINPKNPQDPKRDFFFLSNGHICPILYATLAKKGFFPETELNKFRQVDSLLQGHPSIEVPGIETGAGSLGPVSYTHLTLPTKRIV